MIEPLNLHYAFTNPATVHDEEALTALELAGRQGAKINETIKDQNALRSETESHLADQDATIATRLDAQDDEIANTRDNVVPARVKQEFQTNVNNGTFDKMIDTYAGVLESRVDNLLGRLDEGTTTTTMDAEVIDLRVKVDKGVAPNIGKAVRDQLGNLFDMCSARVVDLSSAVVGSYINMVGDVLSLAGATIVNNIELKRGETIALTGIGYLTNVAMISIQNGNTYTPVVKSIDNNANLYKYTAESDVVVALSFFNSQETGAVIYTSFSTMMQNVNDIGNSLRQYVDLSGKISDSYINYQGNVIKTTSFCYVPNISLKRGQTLKVRCTGYQSAISIISRQNGNTFSPLVISDGDTEKEYMYTAENDDTLAISYWGSFPCSAYIYYNLNGSGGSTEPNASISVFSSMGICGDSYTASQMWDGETLIGDRPQLSWGNIMGRMCGIDSSVFASSGADTNTWKSRDTCLPALLKAEAKQLYVIALGINDYSYVDIGTIDDIKEDHTENPNTFYGNYASIITQLKNHAPDAKIIICKSLLPSNGVSSYYKYSSTAIEEIAGRMGVAYMETKDSVYLNSGDYNANMEHGHPTAIGQGGLAKEMKKLIEETIATNRDYFRTFYG